MDSFTIFTWALTACTIAGTYLNSKQNKYGFLVWGLCNMLWLGVDFTRGIYAQAALYVVFIGFNIYGWQQWGKKSKSHPLAIDCLHSQHYQNTIDALRKELHTISKQHYKLKQKYDIK